MRYNQGELVTGTFSNHKHIYITPENKFQMLYLKKDTPKSVNLCIPPTKGTNDDCISPVTKMFWKLHTKIFILPAS